ncbi:MAG TPA: DUF6079 family protein [Pyrinomonadaceae bacterium]|nr:DUF6079 family protein [Pyrinomonadaceae bacterium]
MKRAQDKIKDLVEPQAFDELLDVAADPSKALAAYRFTDVTSDLLARWLDALADLPRGQGTARALAGARGVGKSHTLAVFSALTALPELRASLEDAHVATSARRLLNRRFTVVRVERGLRPTLVEEIADAFGGSIRADLGRWEREPSALLAIASSRVPDSTLVLVIDTAFNRESRVARDDGPVLSELARAARDTNAFVALALDDDIADASGVNSVLAGSFAIDYLDPEHLYRVADQYLLRKNPQSRAALHDIYLSLRASVPGFNWSEPRFLSLYPVHPLVADVAAAVRLYAPRFAFLPFAASAAARAAGRPALALIQLDEVFDRAEHELRKSPDLEDAFAAYDDLSSRVVSQFPVMQRLQAKLVLKSLFIHSLDGRGATASELCAALLLREEDGATARIGETLARFEAAAGERFGRGDEGAEAHYRFQISASTRFDKALAESVERAPQSAAALDDLLRVVARARFDDWPLVGEHGEPLPAANFHVNWRGSERPGRIVWQQTPAEPPPADPPAQLDWQVFVLPPAADEHAASGDKDDASRAFLNSVAARGDSTPPVTFVWRPAALTAEEMNALRRLIALRSDARLAEVFGETAHAAASLLHAQAQRVWARVYMDEGVLVSAAARRTFTEEARSAPTLSAALAQTFAPHFGLRYPQHPLFPETLGDAAVADLIDAFLGNADASDARAQHLARAFAQPLGLAAQRDGRYTFETGDEVLRSPWVRELLALLDAVGDGQQVPMETASRLFRREPYGLVQDAQHLVLAALVAQRRVEFVTHSGDLVSRRTLSRTPKWEDMAGVARPAAVHQSVEDLTAWARLVTGVETLASDATPDARAALRNALADWLEDWRSRRLLERFNALPDDAMTTRAWDAASSVRKNFGAAADAVEAALAGEVSLEEGLQRVADAFGDAAENYERAARLLDELTSFVESYAEREGARAYLAFAEPTGRDDIESARRELLTLSDDAHTLFDRERAERFSLLWREFHARYTEHYAEAHERAANATRERADLEELLRGPRWHDFEQLSQLPVVGRRDWDEADRLLRDERHARCDLPVRQLLEEQPVCACSFRLARGARTPELPRTLEELTARALTSYRRTLTLFSKQLRHALDALAAREEDAEVVSRARALANALAVGLIPEHLSRANVRLIDRAVRSLNGDAAVVRVPAPAEGEGPVTRDELAARLRRWLDELPGHSSLVEVVSARETDAA